MEEKFVRGVIGGVIAGIIKDVPDCFLHYILKVTQIIFWDYSGVVAMGHHPRGFTEYLYAASYEVIFSIMIGIIFVYYIEPHFRTKHFILRGAIYGALVWFVIRAGVIAFHILPLIDGDVLSAAINSCDSIIFGMVLGTIIHLLEKKDLASGLSSEKTP